MAQKKLITLDKLSVYNDEVKKVINAGDAKALSDAKAYADGLASNYDAAGSAATAKTEAIEASAADATSKVNALSNGQVAINKADIAAIKDDANIDSFADVVAELAKKQDVGDYATKTEAQGYADAKDAAISAAKSAAEAAQADADTNADAIAAINNESTGILANAKSFATSEDAKVQANIDGLSGKVGTVPEGQTVMGIITNIQQNAYDDSGIQSEIDSIGAKVTTLVGTDDNKSVRTIANEELAAQLIPEGAKDSLDTLTEIAAWIQSHPDDASAMNAAIEALQAKVDTGDKTVSAYVTDAIAALSIGDYAKASDLTALAGRVSTLETTSATHATKTALEAEVSERTDADTALSNRITTLETAVGESGSVATDIAAAKDEAISTAAADATAKANQALTDAKAHTNTEVGKDRTRLDALEADTHTHSNKTLLDTYTQTEVNLADAVTKKHSHANSAVLDGIDSAKVTAWDKVTSKADTTALTDEVNRATAKEAALESAINDMVEASEEEVKALFATA